MQHAQTPSTAQVFRRPVVPLPPHSSQVPSTAALVEWPTGRGFAALLSAFRTTGGTARGDDVARVLEDHGIGDCVGLARLVAGAVVFGFEWGNTLWIPMFQFELRDLSVKPAPQQVLAELGVGFANWSCAVWFASPNSWLKQRTPVGLVATHLTEVLEAARADRFIAIG